MHDEWGLTGGTAEAWRLLDYDEERIAQPAYEEARRRGLGEWAARAEGWEAVKEHHRQCPRLLVEQRQTFFLHPSTTWAQLRTQGKKQLQERFGDRPPAPRGERSMADIPYAAKLLWVQRRNFWLDEGLDRQEAIKRAWSDTLARLPELREDEQRWKSLFGPGDEGWRGCGG
jgi:hypothetical protein